VRSGWRLTAIGVVFLSLFGILVLRLWYLQVTTVQESLRTAESQQLLTVTIEAPRGNIYDANGTVMAGTRAALGIVIDGRLVPEEREDDLIRNLAALLGKPAREIRQVFEDAGPGTRFRIGGEMPEETAFFALEHIEDFPGLAIEPVPIRTYPLGELAAHVVGYIGAPGEDDLRRPEVTPQDRVGKFGVEGSYDRLLRGTPGEITYRVNAQGQILGIVEDLPPVPGGSVVSTIDLEVQARLEEALVEGMALSESVGEDPIRASGVIIDPQDGSVVAMASVPAYDPELFADGQITQAEWETVSENAALNNFAIQGLFPPASAFKVVGYTLALEWAPQLYPDLSVYPEDFDAEAKYGNLINPNDPSSFYADGSFDFPATPVLEDWKVHGETNIHTSLHASVDQYYWGIALKIWNDRGEEWDENLLQDWARTLGFGERTGVDLPFEQAGLVPDREWFQYHQANATGVVREEGGWAAGDLMNIAIGQGALVSTPLQLANAYSALVNGGTLWKPRVVDVVQDSEGRTIYTNVPSALRSIDIDPTTVVNLKNDLNGVVAGARGTARVSFAEFCGPGVPASECDSLRRVGGKTGTAEIRVALTEDDEEVDTAWFVGVAPLDDPHYVVAVVIDEGGSGGKVAAPTARAILQYLMGEEVTEITSGGEDTE
jgi:penicillin-binding protein 2